MTRQSSFVSVQNDILLFRCAGRSALCFLLPFIKALHDLIIGLTADGRQFSAQFHTGSLEALLHRSAEGIDLGGIAAQKSLCHIHDPARYGIHRVFTALGNGLRRLTALLRCDIQIHAEQGKIAPLSLLDHHRLERIWIKRSMRWACSSFSCCT